jgi:predicted negative regulator of RcsB-dependent stress response
MSTFDLEEQEQLEQLKHFWRRWGNTVMAAVSAALLVWAAWNGWHWWKRDQAAKAAGFYEALEQGVVAGDLDRVSRAFGDLKDRHPGTLYAAQGGLIAARLQAERGKVDVAEASLGWVADQGAEPEYRTIAALRLAALLADEKKFDAALQRLSGDHPKALTGLVNDRRGDILQAQGKTAEAIAAYEAARAAIPDTSDYRRVIEAKLIGLGKAVEEKR